MVVIHLTSSTHFGGPERQMLGLARSMADEVRTDFVSFSEGGRCSAFLEQAGRQGFAASSLRHDTPYLRAAVAELTDHLRSARAEVLCCHGYKADLLGRLSARRCGIPVVAISRGWTGENRKVRLFEACDKLNLRWMDRVICVSHGQARKVLRAGVPASRVTVIHNAIRSDRFVPASAEVRESLQNLFPSRRSHLVCAAGRLSPEKGYANLIAAAERVVRELPEVGIVLYGDGPLREELAREIVERKLSDAFVLAGFRDDLDRLLPSFDLFVLPSFTEGLPNVVLEAFAAGVPVVATAVGGTPEVVEDGTNGFLVPAGDVPALAQRMQAVLATEHARSSMGESGRQRVLREFTFEAQAAAYRSLFATLTAPCTLQPDPSVYAEPAAWTRFFRAPWLSHRPVSAQKQPVVSSRPNSKTPTQSITAGRIP